MASELEIYVILKTTGNEYKINSWQRALRQRHGYYQISNRTKMIKLHVIQSHLAKQSLISSSKELK